MQHSIKAGGTTLCMTLRLNMYGLIWSNQCKRKAPPIRKTCQICDFCCDCNLKEKSDYSISSLSSMEKHAMDGHKQNFMEIEGSGVR